MAIDLEIIIFLTTTIVGLISFVWKLGETKKQFYDYINSHNSDIQLNLARIEHKLDLEIQENEHREESLSLTFNGKYERLQHKCIRLEAAISDINNYLEKTGEFKPRRGLNRTE